MAHESCADENWMRERDIRESCYQWWRNVLIKVVIALLKLLYVDNSHDA